MRDTDTVHTEHSVTAEWEVKVEIRPCPDSAFETARHDTFDTVGREEGDVPCLQGIVMGTVR